MGGRPPPERVNPGAKKALPDYEKSGPAASVSLVGMWRALGSGMSCAR